MRSDTSGGSYGRGGAMAGETELTALAVTVARGRARGGEQGGIGEELTAGLAEVTATSGKRWGRRINDGNLGRPSVKTMMRTMM